MSSGTPTPARPRRTAAVALVAGLLGAAVAGCSSDEPTSGGLGPTLPDDLALSTTTLPEGTDGDGGASPPTTGHGGVIPPSTVPGASELRFEVVAPITCEGPSFEAEARWEGFPATRAVLLVDNVQVADTVPPEGPYVLDLPCDGRAHTVILFVQAADGSDRMGTKAVLSTPEG